jgi:hypothetical protein
VPRRSCPCPHPASCAMGRKGGKIGGKRRLVDLDPGEMSDMRSKAIGDGRPYSLSFSEALGFCGNTRCLPEPLLQKWPQGFGLRITVRVRRVPRHGFVKWEARPAQVDLVLLDKKGPASRRAHTEVTHFARLRVSKILILEEMICNHQRVVAGQHWIKSGITSR